MKRDLDKDEEFALIGSYYEKIWSYLNDNDYKSATHILYNEMPVDLYDKSLDILDNRNESIMEEELRHLITKVDNKLCQESQDNLDFEEKGDNFNEQF